MKTITFTPDTIALVNGEIYLTPNSHGKTFVWQGGQLRNFYATTNTSIPNVKHIDRSLFVNPDVEDMKDAVREWMYDGSYHYFIEAEAIKYGYNANKKDFTREEMEQAMSYATAFPKRPHEEILNMFRPLSIPKSVICDEEYNIIEVKWK